jgi:hypothetical protein
MSKTNRDQQLLNWLENEKIKDSLEIKKSKEKIAKEIKELKKEEIFVKKEKKSIWKKIRVMIWGN